jgi:hypothetical protein
MSEERADVLPGAIAGSALSCGDLVYLDSAGAWQKAQAVTWAKAIPANVTRKDAVGVITADCQANEFISPVKWARFSGATALTIGGKIYLSATAGANTQTKPYEVQVQEVVGMAVSASEFLMDLRNPSAKAKVDASGISTVVYSAKSASGDLGWRRLVAIDANGLLVDADASASSPLPAIGVTLDTISATVAGNVYDNAILTTTGLTAGARQYLSGTAGATAETAPSGATDIVQSVGVAIITTSALININHADAILHG